MKGYRYCFLGMSCIFLFGNVGEAFPAGKAFPCRVEILQVLEATIYRGPPHLVQILERNPERAELINAESHGDHHLSCTYKVLLNSKSYRYKAEFSNTLLDLQEAYCNSSKAKRQVRKIILQMTDDCQNPNAQPVWGNPLDPG